MVEGIPVPGVYLGVRTDLTEVSGTSVQKVPNVPKSGTDILKITELTEESGNGIAAAPNLPISRVLLSRLYRTNIATLGIVVEGIPVLKKY